MGHLATFRRLPSTVFLGVLWLSSACNYRHDKMEMPVNAEATFTSVQRYIVEPKCMTCHNGGGSPKGADLSSYEAMMAMGLIVPFKPEQSKLFQRLADGSMPPGNPLAPRDLAMVEAWIRSGAAKDGKPKPPDPPPTASYAWISEYFFAKRCNGCHNGKHPRTKLDLTSYDKMMAFEGEVLRAIEPGDAELSGVYGNIRDGLMPPPKGVPPKPDPVAQEIQAVISQWINEGAKP